MTILRLAHLDLEGLVLDSAVRQLRDQFVTHNWSTLMYQGLYFSPECDWLTKCLLLSQERVNGLCKLRLFKGNVSVLGRSSDTEKLYSSELASMVRQKRTPPVYWSNFADRLGYRTVSTISTLSIQRKMPLFSKQGD